MKGLWGKKVGMTQVFANDKVIPVTVIDASDWIVTNIKTQVRDGYDAIQIGCLKKKYKEQQFADSWLKELKKHFTFVREVKVDNTAVENVVVGQTPDFFASLNEGEKVDVVGRTKGCGFAGVLRRHGFAGGPRTHGSCFKNIPGSMSFMRSQGRVIKGKRLPGHMGNKNHMVKNLPVVQIKADAKLILVKGAIPGKAGSLVFVRKVQR
jgi:large subunit ribosomal protein L3